MSDSVPGTTAPGAGLRERGKLDKRRRIMEAAREVFIEHGYEQATTREIAARAGVSVGTVFVYAKDKRDLLLLIVNGELDAVSAKGQAALDRPGTLVERLTREVQQLRQDQSQAALQQALAPPLRIAEPPPIPITLVFRDGRRLTTQSYAISRQTLWVVGDRMSMRVDLKDLDLPATQQANLGRVLLLPVPTQ